MPRQQHEAHFAEPMTVVFAALLRSLARRRWGEGEYFNAAPCVPRVGCHYMNQRGSVLRRGRVLECLRPVSLTLYETLIDSPCCVQLRLRWRLEPVATGSLLRLGVGYDLNGAASLRRRHWNENIHAHCGRMFGLVRSYLCVEAHDHGAATGVSGQSHGSNNIDMTKMIAVSGKPSFR